jgi:hypothetical protein
MKNLAPETVRLMQAALEVCRYCEDSCCFIFGDSLGDVTADTIRAALLRNPDGMTRTESEDSPIYTECRADREQGLRIEFES